MRDLLLRTFGPKPSEDTEQRIEAYSHNLSQEVRNEIIRDIADAIASYYDAFSSAMLRYYLSGRLKEEFELPDLPDITDDHAVFLALKSRGVIDDSFTDINFHQVVILLDAAFEGGVEKYDYQGAGKRSRARPCNACCW